MTNEEIAIEVIKKRVKRISLTISKDAKVKLTMPYGIDREYVEEFLQRNSKWIRNKISSRRTQIQNYKSRPGQDESWILHEGEMFPIEILYAKKTSVCLKNEKLTIETPLNPDEIDIKATVEMWRRETAYAVFSEVLHTLFCPFDKNFKLPTLRIKKMTTRWGSYSINTNIMNLNLNLLKTPRESIEYIIMHELCHLKYLNHQAEFYELFRMLMPDEKQREKNLEAFCREWEVLSLE